MTDEERIALMRKRYAFFSEMVKGYTDIHTFFIENDERFAIMGMELSEGDNYLTIYIQLDFTEYEYYHIVVDSQGRLVVENNVTWDYRCATSEVDIFTDN